MVATTSCKLPPAALSVESFSSPVSTLIAPHAVYTLHREHHGDRTAAAKRPVRQAGPSIPRAEAGTIWPCGYRDQGHWRGVAM